MKSGKVSLSKLDRKTIERNRRMQMKGLSFKLASLIPRHYNSTKEISSQQDRLDHAASYIKELQQRVEELKRKKQYLATDINKTSKDIEDETIIGSTLPQLELREFDHSLEVTLISGLNRNFSFSEVVSVLAEEGAEIVNASFSVVGDKIFHIIHSQAASSRVGVETSRLSQRLKELVH